MTLYALVLNVFLARSQTVIKRYRRERVVPKLHFNGDIFVAVVNVQAFLMSQKGDYSDPDQDFGKTKEETASK